MIQGAVEQHWNWKQSLKTLINLYKIIKDELHSVVIQLYLAPKKEDDLT